MAFTAAEIEGINQIIRDWARQVADEARSNAPKRSGELSQKISTKFKQDGPADLIWKVVFQYPPHGLFLELGVFGGMTLEKARQSGKAKPRPWLTPSLRNHYPELSRKISNKSMVIVGVAIKRALEENSDTNV
jgi:hypothetical protein